MRVVLLVVALTGANSARAATWKNDPSILSSAQLMQAFVDNEFAFRADYIGKPVKMGAAIDEIRSFPGGTPYITLKTGRLINRVRCHFKKPSVAVVRKLQPGQLVAITGIVEKTFLTNITIKNCEIHWTGPNRPWSQEELVHNVLSLTSCFGSLGRVFIPPERWEQEDFEEKLAVVADSSRKVLANRGMVPWKCNHPLLGIAFHCIDRTNSGDPECESELVQTLLTELPNIAEVIQEALTDDSSSEEPSAQEPAPPAPDPDVEPPPDVPERN